MKTHSSQKPNVEHTPLTTKLLLAFALICTLAVSTYTVVRYDVAQVIGIDTLIATSYSVTNVTNVSSAGTLQELIKLLQLRIGEFQSELEKRNNTVTNEVTNTPNQNQSEDTYDVYVAVDGNDNNSGLTPGNPVRTLERADEIVAELISENERDITVFVAGGLYTGQTVRWDSTMNEYTVTLKGDPDDRPIFDGEGNLMRWLLIQHNFTREIGDTNLHISGFQIQNYLQAISLYGSIVDGDTRYISANVIEDNTFTNIGGTYVSGIDMGYSAIGGRNARNNIIRNNEFTNIRNDHFTSCESGSCNDAALHMHALYLNAYSSGNEIYENTFTSVSGAAIDTRDFSNFNVISNNTFDDVHSVFMSYYRHYTPEDEPDHIECPTWGNRVTNNKLGTKYGRAARTSVIDDTGDSVGIKTYFHPETTHEEYCEQKRFLATYKLDPTNPLHNTGNTQRLISSNNGLLLSF